MSTTRNPQPPFLFSRLHPNRNKRSHPRTRLIRILLSTLFLAYFLLLCFPRILFAHSTTYKQFQVYTTTPPHPNLYPLLDQAAAKLNRSEIADPTIRHQIYLCPNNALYTLLAPNSRNAFAVNLPFTHNIFVNTNDIPHNRVTTPSRLHNQRTLSGVIAHECTHTLLAKAFGELALQRYPNWKKEGYCDYIADETSFNRTEGTRLLQQNRSDPSPSFTYFKAFTALHYLLETKHQTLRNTLEQTTPLETILSEAIKPE